MQISLTPDYSLLAIMVIFIINYFVVSKFFIKPINAVLESRAAETRIPSPEQSGCLSAAIQHRQVDLFVRSMNLVVGETDS